jgi:16S rRNA (guanine966-N2)-methyltransferase
MRVIAGAFGGRSLVAPKGQATRPTSDRVREALFSVLGDVTDALVLDLYAGTGALGIEALSRGAKRAVFVENARPALDALRRNLDTLNLRQVTSVVATPVAKAVRGLTAGSRFDLVLVDPPYADLNEAVKALQALVRAGHCADDVRIVLEHASRDAGPEIEGLDFEMTRRYGDTSMSFYLGRIGQPDDPAKELGSNDGESSEDVSSGDRDE